MPRYFFDIYDDGRRYRDRVGTEFATEDSLIDASIEVLPAASRERLFSVIGQARSLVLVVNDERGHPINSATVALNGKWLNRHPLIR